MERSLPSQGGAFQVYLRLRPPLNESKDSLRLPERCLTVEPPSDSESYSEDEQSQSLPTHITLQPPNDARKRAVEMFAFTKIFEEHAGQLEVFEEIGMGAIMRGVLGEGRDGLVATLGVTGSGKVRRDGKWTKDHADEVCAPEPYNPRIQIATRNYPDDTRRFVSFSRGESATIHRLTHSQLDCRVGSFRGPDSVSSNLYRKRLW